MFNLSEEWKRAYAEFLKEDEAQFNEDVDSLLVELTESQTEIEKGFDIVSSYYSLCCLTEEGPLGTVTQNKSWKEAETEDKDRATRIVQLRKSALKYVVSRLYATSALAAM